LKNRTAAPSKIFDLHPHSPGNDGNGSNVNSNSAISGMPYRSVPKGIEAVYQELAGEKHRKLRLGWQVLKDQTACSPRSCGTHRETQTSFGKVWVD